jgi:fructose-bisphosphate aldolase class II
MKTLKDVLQKAEHDRVAVGHFNFSDLVAFDAIAAAARKLKLPVMVGVSEGERAFVGVRHATALVRSVREEYDQEIFLNADHTHSIAKAEEAAYNFVL